MPDSLPPEERAPLYSFRDVLQSASRPAILLLLLGMLLPVVLLGALAYQKQREVRHELERTAQRSVAAIEQHLASVMQNHALLLHKVAEDVGNRSWSEVQNDGELQKQLARHAATHDQVLVVGVTDANGSVLAIGGDERDFPDADFSNSDYFLEPRHGNRGMFFSAPFEAPNSGARQFAISMARLSPSGNFDGIVFATVPLDYFARFWDRFVPSDGYLIPLMRSDGVMLLRYPTPAPPSRLDRDAPFPSHVRRSPNGLYAAISRVDGIERINAYRQVSDYPLFVSFSAETGLVDQKWRKDMMPALILAMLATAALVTLSLTVMRQSYLQRRGTLAWRRIANDLQDEIAKRKATEEKLVQAQKMEAFGQMTGGIAHDFNNMLASVSGNLELIRLRLAAGQIVEASHCVDRAETVVDKASRQIQRLLTFARRKKLENVAVDINALLREASEMFQDAVGADFTIETRLPPHAPVALCDPHQLESALLNLVVNARDAMPNGGTIILSASNGQPHDEDSGAAQEICVSVSDSGVGMSQEVIERAFEPFYTTKDIGEGSGLGLPMVLGFAQQSGGRVQIESALGAGTTVKLYLPAGNRLSEVGTTKEELSGLPAVALRGSILLVEDDLPLREVLVEVLKSRGAEVLQAGSADEALKLVADGPAIDLVVSDIGLPGELNGYQLADRLRTRFPDIRFLFISGFSGKFPSSGRYLNEGDRVLAKPFRIELFLATLVEIQNNTDSQNR